MVLSNSLDKKHLFHYRRTGLRGERSGSQIEKGEGGEGKQGVRASKDPCNCEYLSLAPLPAVPQSDRSSPHGMGMGSDGGGVVSVHANTICRYLIWICVRLSARLENKYCCITII